MPQEMNRCGGVADPHVDGYCEGKRGVKPDGAAGSHGVGGCTAHEHNLSGCLESGTSHAIEPVAIVGMAMRLPGGIRDSESFWDLLINKRSSRCRVPKDRFNIDTWYAPGKVGHAGNEYGYFLEDLDLAQLDASFWSMTKQEAEAMDPQQRLILEVVYECLENAGAKNWRGKNIGCYLGSFESDWLELDLKDSQNMHTYRLTGYGDYMQANRVSYEFGFTGPRLVFPGRLPHETELISGPSITTRTACSSSLTGLHEACQALYSGECMSAIVGGTNIIISPRLVVTMTEKGVLSPTGSCKSFDADADGYARGEAVSAIYIKKLRDAIRDGDPVRAVIRSTCISSDGKTPSLTMPNAGSHEALIRRGHHIAGIYDFSKTAMIECHGTGTKVGDPIETAAVASVFGEYGIYIGSVKPNIGHSEGASGISSVIKMVLALEKKTIPPNINFKKPNPLIPFEEAKLKVPTDAMPWPADRMERVGVNCFGIGGSNAHVLIESAASFGLDRPATTLGVDSADNMRPHLLVFSAKHPEALRRSMENYKSYLSASPNALSDISYSLSTRRETFTHRAFCIASGLGAYEVSKISKPGEGGPPNLVFVFTGQGAQWALMGRELIEKEPIFRERIQVLDDFLSQLPDPPNWRLQDEILQLKQRSRLSDAEFSQPCCTAIQVALVDLLGKWNVKPAAVVGHSSGEIAAAYACGSITATEAILIAYYRGQAVRGVGKTHHGRMAAIGLGREQAAQYLLPGVTIGCENSPENVTLSGDADTLGGIMGHIHDEHPDVLVRSLHVDCAYHSHHMKAVEAEYQSLLGNAIRANAPEVPFYSSVTGKIVTSDEVLSASYWSQNLVSPVLFYSAVSAIVASSSTAQIFLEIGPHSALAGPIRQILRNSEKVSDYVPTLTRNGDGMLDLLNTAGQLWTSNVGIDLSSINPPGKILTNLPTYPWHYENQYWVESRLSKEWRFRKFPHHDILGSRITESTDIEPSWRNMLRLDNVPWIRDHEIAQDILLPGAAYVAMVGEAIRQLTGSSDFSVRHVNFSAALVLHEGEVVEVITHFRPARLTATLNSSWFEFTVASLNGATWVKHCDGQARAGCEFQPPVPSIEPFPRRVQSSTWYRVMRRVGFNYGPRFRGLSGISAHVSERKAVATLSDNLEEKETPYQLHPTTLDCTFQLFTAAASNGIARLLSKLSVPTYIEELYLRPPKGGILIQAEADVTARGTLFGDLVGVSEGETVINMRGFRLSPLGGGDEATSNDPHAAAELEWKSHLNFVDAAQLMRPLKNRTKSHLLVNRLALACMIETRARIRDLEAAMPHLEKFRKWLDSQEERAAGWQYPNVPDCASIAGMGSLERAHLIQDLLERSVGTEAAAAAIAVHRILLSCSEIFTGSANPLELLLEGNILTGLYDFVNNSDYSEFIDLVAHNKPNLKILEVGAGTGGAANAILPHLKSAYGERMYSSYTYTDISAGFFAAARERFRDFQAMEYATLDISKDPIEQGFEAESFDLIIACNVLHATPNLNDTLEHVRKLLHPRGRLLLQELCPLTKWINYVMGVLPGWWLGDHDGRSTEPYVTAERWNEELKNAGFEGVDVVVYDGHLNNDIIAIPAYNNQRPKRLTILCRGVGASNVGEVSSRLRKKGYELDFCTMDQIPVPGQDIVSLLDLEQPLLHSASAAQFDAFRDFITRTRDSGILWVTGASQIACRDPRYSLILGMARTIRLEYRIDFATLELEAFDTDGWGAVADIFHEFESRIHDSNIDPDLEYAYSAGKVQISRYHWLSMLEALSGVGHQLYPRKLDMHEPGSVRSLYWKQIQPVPLVGDEVEIEMRAVGLNFKDVLLSMGIIEGRRREGRGLGLEGAGIIRRVGPEATNLKVGDKVLCICSGSFQTTLTVTEKLCSKMADGLSFVEAATMPCVYNTAIYSLMDLARLQKGQSVLIHSACGGVGMAAIQVSQMIGAEIFCTVGNVEKVDYLMKNFGVPRNRVFHSRDRVRDGQTSEMAK
ncbi:MAG: Type I Iterative PKS, partial [Geoglossum simile]